MSRAAIPEKVRRIIPTLGSPVDAEALAACRAVGRTLAAVSLDYHDLAAAIPAGETNVDNVHVDRQPGPRPFDTYGWRHAFTPKQEREHRDQVRFCQSRPHRLSAWERKFISNVARLHGNLSIRQGDRLAVIVDRIEREGRCA